MREGVEGEGKGNGKSASRHSRLVRGIKSGECN